jgi:hypothetical protein
LQTLATKKLVDGPIKSGHDARVGQVHKHKHASVMAENAGGG